MLGTKELHKKGKVDVKTQQMNYGVHKQRNDMFLHRLLAGLLI